MEYRTVELLKSVGIAPSILQFEATNYCCEFRTPDESVVFDYGTLTGDRPHYVYPQHELVARLCDALEWSRRRHPLRLDGHRSEQDDDGVTLVDRRRRRAGRRDLDVRLSPAATVVRGVIAGSLRGCTVVEQSLPVRWLAMLGQHAAAGARTPSTPRIRAASPDRCAGSRPSPASISRCPPATRSPTGRSDRVRDELTTRLMVPGRLDDVEFIEPTLVDLRMKMTTPMQDGRVFVAGDAAHVITPAGGKGMNLAIQDAVELANGLIERFGPRHGRRSARPLLRHAPAGDLADAGVLAVDAAADPRRFRRVGRAKPMSARSAPAFARAGCRHCNTTRHWPAGSPTPTPASTPTRPAMRVSRRAGLIFTAACSPHGELMCGASGSLHRGHSEA